MPNDGYPTQNQKTMVKTGEWVNYNNKKKKCYGIHTNGNILIKMNNKIVQITKDKITLW